MAAQITTLSSAGTSTAIILDPVRKATTVQLTVTNPSSATIFIQYTLDDPTIVSGSSVVWANLSSAIASSAVDTGGNNGIMYSVLSPLGGLRLSSSTYTSGTQTLKALTSVTG